MPKIKVKKHIRKGKSVRQHDRTKRPKVGPAGPVNSQGHMDGPDLNTGQEESAPTYTDLRDKLMKQGDNSAFRPMMEMAKARSSAGIKKEDSPNWETKKVNGGKHFEHTHKKTGKVIRKKNPNYVQGDHSDAQI